VVEVDSKIQWWPFQSRKESIKNCLLIETRGLYYIQNSEAKWGGRTEKRDKEWINKTAKSLEERKTETEGKVKAGMKTTAAWLEWLTLLAREHKLTAACFKRLNMKKVKSIVVQKNRVFEQILQ